MTHELIEATRPQQREEIGGYQWRREEYKCRQHDCPVRFAISGRPEDVARGVRLMKLDHTPELVLI